MDISITAAVLSPNISPSTSHVGAAWPAPAAGRVNDDLVGLVPGAPASSLTPPASPRGCCDFPAISGTGVPRATTALSARAKLCLRADSAPSTHVAAPVASNLPPGKCSNNIAGVFSSHLLSQGPPDPGEQGGDAIEQTLAYTGPLISDCMARPTITPPTAFLAGNCSLGASCANIEGAFTPLLVTQDFEGQKFGLADETDSNHTPQGWLYADSIVPANNFPPCLLKPKAAFPGPVLYAPAMGDARLEGN